MRHPGAFSGRSGAARTQGDRKSSRVGGSAKTSKILAYDAENVARAGSVGSMRVWTPKARIKAAQLPTEGKIRFVPDEDYQASMALPRGESNGYIDKCGNEGIKGPSSTPGQPFEWDVQ